MGTIVDPSNGVCNDHGADCVKRCTSAFEGGCRATGSDARFIGRLTSGRSMGVDMFGARNVGGFSPRIGRAVVFRGRTAIGSGFVCLGPLIFLRARGGPFARARQGLPMRCPCTRRVALSIGLAVPRKCAMSRLPRTLRVGARSNRNVYHCGVTMRNGGLAVGCVFGSDGLLCLPARCTKLRRF